MAQDAHSEIQKEGDSSDAFSISAEAKFSEILILFKRLSDEMSHVVETYYAWKNLVFARSIQVVGQEMADQNAKIMDVYKYFFTSIESSLMHTFIIGITKFFDRDPESLSIAHLVGKIEACKEEITPEILQRIYPGRFNTEELRKGYTPLDEKDLRDIEELRTKHQIVIKKLKRIRNKQLAHTDIHLIKGEFIPTEVEELIVAVQKMFNKLSGRFDRSTTMWDHLPNYLAEEILLLLENLKKGERERLSEIQKQWGITQGEKS